MEYLPSLVSANIFTSTGSDGNFNGNFAIRRSEIAVITSRGLAYVSANLDKVKGNGNAPAGEDLSVNNSDNKGPEENKNNDANNALNNNSILNGEEAKGNTEELTPAEVGTMVNFKGEVIEVIDGGNVKYIRVKVTESDSDKFGPGNIITINTFKAHKLKDLVEGSGIFGENSLTNIKLK